MPQDRQELVDELQSKLKALNETTWNGRAPWPRVETWLAQFKRGTDLRDDEQLQMLFLVSHFIYFGSREIRWLLRSMYADLYQTKQIQQIRRQLNDTRDRTEIARKLTECLAATRFLGIGNPSESGSHLLYYFRQENRLGKEYFIHSGQILSSAGYAKLRLSRITNPSTKHYVFLDDLCGSGTQAREYTENIVRPLKGLSSSVRVSYFTLFATSSGLSEVRKLGWFDDVAAVVELDETFKCFGPKSRVYRSESAPFSKDRAEMVAHAYGVSLFPAGPLGWRNGQLLIGFAHNTPDNTLPIIWYDEPEGPPWAPLFRRMPKHYGWEA